MKRSSKVNLIIMIDLFDDYFDLVFDTTRVPTYSSGPNNSVVLNKRGGWTIYPK